MQPHKQRGSQDYAKGFGDGLCNYHKTKNNREIAMSTRSEKDESLLAWP
jgi:hypothetical protein